MRPRTLGYALQVGIPGRSPTTHILAAPRGHLHSATIARYAGRVIRRTAYRLGVSAHAVDWSVAPIPSLHTTGG